MRHSLAILALTASAFLTSSAAAADITVLSAGAMEPGVVPAAAEFQRGTKQAVNVSFDTVPQIRTRVAGGEAKADVVIATPAALDELAAAGKVDKGAVILGRVGMGVAIRAGAPVPDLSSSEALKRSILGADRLVFSRGSSGVYFEGLLKQMGLFDQLGSKIVRYPDGAAVFAHIQNGTGNELAFGQLTEIGLEVEKGLRLAGPLPADVQNYTTYAAAPMASGPNLQAARSFVQFLASPAGKAFFTKAGIQ